MVDLEKLLVDFAHRFDRMGISYAVMGGFAVRVFGIPRPTYDLDFTVLLTRDRMVEFLTELQRDGFTIPEPYFGGWVDDVKGLSVVKLQTYLGSRAIDIDIFLAENRFQKQVMARRQRAPINGDILWFVTPEDLVLFKLFAGRNRDLADVGDVLLMQGQLDVDYMRRWASHFELLPALERFLTEAGYST